MEQRRHQRFELHLPYQLQLPGCSHQITGLTRNVSAKGVFLPYSGGLQQGDRIQYALTLPQAPGAQGEVRVQCLGTIGRVDGDGMLATVDAYEFVREASSNRSATAAA